MGGGPAGSVLATFLVRSGHQVFIFDNKQVENDLFVGESLIPAIIPILQELGVEEEVKSYSVYKPGAVIWLDRIFSSEASFANGMGSLPPYAYNTVRKKFDKTLLDNALKEGAILIKETAKVTEGENGKLALHENCLQALKLYTDKTVDFIVDASGRRRTLARWLNLETEEGKRHDTALFAHVEHAEMGKNPQCIHMHRAVKNAWFWRIPLPHCVSVGVIANKAHLDTFGSNAEEQFDQFLQTEASTTDVLRNVKRISKVQKFSNYQLTTKQVYGKNWALVGDAAGFLDPVFSSGLYLAMKYAKQLARAIDENDAYTLRKYEADWKRELKAWQKMIAIWYNGRLHMSNFVGSYVVPNNKLLRIVGKRIEPHIIKQFTSIFTGEAVLNPYSMWLLGFLTGPWLNMMDLIHMRKLEPNSFEI